MEELKNDKYTFIVYTDGSAAPNPGFYGSGVHGYGYKEEDIDVKNTDMPPLGQTPTINGYMLVENVKNNVKVKPVKPSIYLNGMCCFGEDVSTNNVGEILATSKIINFIMNSEYDTGTIVIKSDSEYTLGIYDKLVNPDKYPGFDFRTANVKNSKYYELIEALLVILKEKGIELKLNKVKAHGTDFGNNMADDLAVTARIKSSEGVEGDFMKFYTEGKYWKPNIPRHPLLRVKQVFFSHYDRKYDADIYPIMEYDKDTDVGTKTNNSLFGIIKLKKENSKALDELIAYDASVTGGISRLSYIDVTMLHSPKFHVMSQLCKNNILTKRKSAVSLLSYDVISAPTTPQGLAKIGLDLTNSLNATMKKYLSYKEDKATFKDTEFLDITDVVYEVTEKKYILKLDAKAGFIDATMPINGKDRVIKITLGKEILDRNTLKQLEKKKPKVLVALTKKTEMTYDYKTIIDLDDELGIYTNFFTTVIVA